MTRDLPPLANVLAFRSADPRRQRAVRDHLESTFPDVAEVRGWLLARRPFPGSPPIGPAGQLALAEGELVAARGPGGIDGLADDLRRVDAVALARRPGDFGGVWVDDDRIVAVRSAAGRCPVHWWSDAVSIAVGTLLTDVAGVVAGGPEIDPLEAALWASTQAVSIEGRSPVLGVRSLAPGWLVRIARDGRATSTQWWDPWPAELPPDREPFAARAARFGEAVDAVVRAELDAAGGNVLSFSGGVDSSTIAFLAHRAGRPVGGLSLVPLPGDPLLTRQLGYIDDAAAAIGMAPLRTHAVSWNDRLTILDDLPDVVVPVTHPVLCLLGEEAGRYHVFVGGEFCDEIAGGLMGYIDLSRTATVAEAVRKVRTSGPAGLRRWVHRLGGRQRLESPYRPLPEAVRGDVRAEAEEHRAERERAIARSDRLHAYGIELLRASDGAVVQNWEVASQLGLRRCWPFLTRDVLEVVASCRPAELVTPVRKALSRAAFRGVVPDRWLDRADPGTYGAADHLCPVTFRDVSPSLRSVLDGSVVDGPQSTSDRLTALTVAALVRYERSLQRCRTAG